MPRRFFGGAFCYGKGLKIDFFYYKNLFILAISLHLDISKCFEVITVGVSKIGFVQIISPKGDEHLPRVWIATAVIGFGTTLFEVHIQLILIVSVFTYDNTVTLLAEIVKFFGYLFLSQNILLYQCFHLFSFFFCIYAVRFRVLCVAYI